ncbi:MAG: hypothetical protein ACRDP3_12695 [Streptomyces sp.]|uniref:hypothetical protein n=1 Tax=Streptomyces sp. TaxID=1931 RepID=UPI003D6B25DB
MTGGNWGGEIVEFYLGSTREAADDINEGLALIASVNHRSEVTFTIQQLHVIHSCLTGAVVDFISDEDFHLRTGWYRENAIAFARELGRSLRELMATDSASQRRSDAVDGGS